MRSSTREDGVAELPGGPPGGPGIADGPTGYGVAILESLNQYEPIDLLSALAIEHLGHGSGLRGALYLELEVGVL